MEDNVCSIGEASCTAVQVLSPVAVLAGTLFFLGGRVSGLLVAQHSVRVAEHSSHLIDLHFHLRGKSLSAANARPMVQQKRVPTARVDWDIDNTLLAACMIRQEVR